MIKNLTGFESLTTLQEKENTVFDVILLTVKSYDTEPMLKALTACFPDPPPIVSLQNGLGNIEIIETYAGRIKDYRRAGNFWR